MAGLLGARTLASLFSCLWGSGAVGERIMSLLSGKTSKTGAAQYGAHMAVSECRTCQSMFRRIFFLPFLSIPAPPSPQAFLVFSPSGREPRAREEAARRSATFRDVMLTRDGAGGPQSRDSPGTQSRNSRSLLAFYLQKQVSFLLVSEPLMSRYTS